MTTMDPKDSMDQIEPNGVDTVTLPGDSSVAAGEGQASEPSEVKTEASPPVDDTYQDEGVEPKIFQHPKLDELGVREGLSGSSPDQSVGSSQPQVKMEPISPLAQVKMEPMSDELSPAAAEAVADDQKEVDQLSSFVQSPGEAVDSVQSRNVTVVNKRSRSPSNEADLSEEIARKKSRATSGYPADGADSEELQDELDRTMSPPPSSDVSQSNLDDADSVKSGEQPIPSQTGVLRADLVAAILGAPPPSEAAPIAVPIPPGELIVKKKKTKIPPAKVFKAMKEIKEATELLRGAIDLAIVLPEEECRFLAEKLWIVTVQQLYDVLNPQTEPQTNARQQLIDALILSPFVTKDSDALAQTNNDSLNIELSSDRKPSVSEHSPEALSTQNEETHVPESKAAHSQEHHVAQVVRGEGHDENRDCQASPVDTPSDTAAPVPEVKTESDSIGLDEHNSGSTSAAAAGMESLEEEIRAVTVDTTRLSPGVTSESADHTDVGTSMEKGSSGAEGVDATQSDVKMEPHGAVLNEASHAQEIEGATASSPSREPGDAEETVGVKVSTDPRTAAAIKVMESWNEKVTRRRNDHTVVDVNEQFFLEGPVSFLIPLCTRNFLKSANINTVFEFLSLKRTETGVIVDVLAEWRKQCELSERPRQSVAKHLVAIGARLEAIIGSTIPLSSKERQWNADNMMVLGGSAKDFLIYVEVLNSRLFLATTTKELSTKLARWRHKNGLQPLKGTGKVAMVSAWKTQIREALDMEVDSGRVLDGDWMKSFSLETSDVSKSSPLAKKRPQRLLQGTQHEEVGTKPQSLFASTEVTRGKDDSKNKEAETIGTEKETGNSTPSTARQFSKRDLSNPWEALSDGARSFLVSISISDAETFLAAKTKHLAEKLVEYREKNNLVPLRGSGSVASISGWKALVRTAASELGNHELATLNAGRNAGIKLKRKKRNEEDDEDENVRESPVSLPNRKALHPVVIRRRIEPPADVQLYTPKATFSVRNDRQCSRDSSSQSFYLTYLGSESSIPSDAVRVESARGVPILLHASPKAGVELNTQPFLSEQTGLIELNRYGIEPMPHRDLLSVIGKRLKAYVHQEEPTSSCDPSIVYNVFESHGNSGTKYYFFSKELLEKGQTIELNFLPHSPSTSSDYEWRQWISMELDSMNNADLSRLHNFITEDIGPDIYRRVESITTADALEKPIGTFSPETDVDKSKQYVVALRRMHWLVLEIEKAVGKVSPGEALGTTPVRTSPVWKSSLIAPIIKHPLWEDQIRSLLIQECRNEILAEFRSPAFGGFWTSKALWCPVAEQVFNEALSLFSQFNAELETFCSEEELLHDLTRYASEAVLRLRKYSGDVSESESDFDHFMLNFDAGMKHTSNIFPSTAVLWTALNQKYLDCMALAGDSPSELALMHEGNFLAVKRHPLDSSSSRGTEFRFVHDFDPSKESIDLEWYIQSQIVAVIHAMVISGTAMIDRQDKKPDDMASRTLDNIARAIGSDNLGSVELRERSREDTPSVPVAILDVAPTHVCKPDSRSIFLKLVWPDLSKLNWSIETESSSSTIAYSGPGQDRDKRARLLRKEAAAARAKVATKTTELGFGGIPKNVKRLLVSCAAMDDTGPYDDERPAAEFTVSKALRSFEGSFSREHSSISAPMALLRALFENVAPSLVHEDGLSPPNGTSWSEFLGCEFLVRLLYILPNIMIDSDITTSQFESTIGVVKELLAYLASHRKEIFIEKYQYPHEEYVNDFTFKRFIENRIEKTEASGTEKGQASSLMELDLKEVVLPSDRHELTDFVTTVLDQVIIYKATPDDVKSRGRRSFLTVGAPGLICRHCLGRSGEGKYFYSNMQSLATASTSVDKHIVRCPFVSDEIRSRMLQAKSRNAEQRSKSRPGAQSSFFSRLWNRLQLVRTSATSAEPDEYIPMQAANSELEEEDLSRPNSTGNETVFGDHVDVMRYIQTEEPWKSNVELADAVASYYRCLSWGAGIFHTPAMPPHYSSEWILAKMGH